MHERSQNCMNLDYMQDLYVLSFFIGSREDLRMQIPGSVSSSQRLKSDEAFCKWIPLIFEYLNQYIYSLVR